MKKISLDMLNELSLKNEILKKEVEMEKLENTYLKAQNEEFVKENKKLATEVKELSEKIANFQDLMENLPQGNINEYSIKEYLFYLQNSLSEYKRKYAEISLEMKRREDSLDEEKEKSKKYYFKVQSE